MGSVSPLALKFFTYGLPSIMGLLMLNLPAALQFSFAFTSLLSLIQTSVFRLPGFRRWAGIYQLPPEPAGGPTAGGAATAPKTVYSGMLNTYQPPNASGETAKEEKKGIIGGAVAEMKGMSNEAMRSLKNYVGEKKDEEGGRKRRTKLQLREAKAYEERRRKEIAQQRKEARARRLEGRVQER